MANHPLQIDDIFDEALRRAPGNEREQYLSEVCGDDAALKQRITRLLRAVAEAGSFLESPAREPLPTIDQSVTEQPGTQIGPYKLLQQIGEGGMGVVYMAEQAEPVRRRVALKLIKPGMDTRQVIARFEAERQALAVMDHPHIARVLDGGTTESGRPFFVMELVRGTPITQYCDENNLPIRERLELFASVCQAIQHAHTKGIIHRDIKPSNVIITRQDDRPVVKVIDFGIAKAIGQRLTEKTVFTDFAQMIGTPLYMSPEQAELSGTDIDTRSDIYSLGVLLYELLTGTTPVNKEQLKQAAFDEIRRIIREDEPQRPSTRISSAETAPRIAAQRHSEPARLTRLIRGELDWIVMKALEKDRARRYETANGFAQYILRYLHDEPVQACPPSAGYRLRKLARRNKAALTATTLVVVALVLGTVISIWQAVRARDEQRKAIAAADEERKAKVLAEKRLGQVAKANDILASVFRKLNPTSENIDGPSLRTSLAEQLDRASSELEGDVTGDPLRVAQLQYDLGKTLFELGYPDKARELFAKAFQTAQTHLAPDHPHVLASMTQLAAAYRATGEPIKALDIFRTVWQRTRARLGPDDPATLTSMDRLAFAHRGTGREHEGIRIAEEVYTRAKATDPNAREGLYALAMLYVDVGQAAKAVPLIERVLEIDKTRVGIDNSGTLAVMSALGHATSLTGEHLRSALLFQEVLIRYRAVLGIHHTKTMQIAARVGLQGRTLRESGQTLEAEKAFRAAIEVYEVFLAFPPQNLPMGYSQRINELHEFRVDLMQLLKSTGRDREAHELLRQGMHYWEGIAKRSPDLPEVPLIEGESHELLGNRAAAVNVYSAAIEK